MTYSSSLTDAEWELLEPLLLEVLPPKKKIRPLDWSYRAIIDGILYRLKNGCNWEDLPNDLPPYSTVYWHYKQWREAGTIENLMTVLHERVRAQVKKNRNGPRSSSLTRRQWRIPVMLVWTQKGSAFTKRRMGSSAISPSISLGFPSLPCARQRTDPTMLDWLNCWSKISTIFAQSLWIFPRLRFY